MAFVTTSYYQYDITLVFFQTEMYTRVLMGAIDLASAKLPKNTNDGAVDILTRHYLYAKGLDYRHGTGHGIGSYLKVCKFNSIQDFDFLLYPVF